MFLFLAPRNPNAIFHRMADAVTFPGPPSKPVATNLTETSVALTWTKNAKIGSSALIGFTGTSAYIFNKSISCNVEYFKIFKNKILII